MKFVDKVKEITNIDGSWTEENNWSNSVFCEILGGRVIAIKVQMKHECFKEMHNGISYIVRNEWLPERTDPSRNLYSGYKEEEALDVIKNLVKKYEVY